MATILSAQRWDFLFIYLFLLFATGSQLAALSRNLDPEGPEWQLPIEEQTYSMSSVLFDPNEK